jgi:hypothetical protein
VSPLPQSSHIGPWIALAGLFVGAGLYLGLRDARVPPPAAEPEAPATAVAMPAPPGERAEQELARTAGRADIAAFLAAQRPTLQRRCWDEAVRAGMDPSPATFRYDVTVDRRGQQVIRSILDAPEETRTGVADCLQRETAPIQIPAPGVVVSADIAMSFP